MEFDQGSRELANFKFKYVKDPVITRVRRGRAGQSGQRNGPRGIPSGGITLTVDGEGFGVIHSPLMYVEHNDIKYNSVSIATSL